MNGRLRILGIVLGVIGLGFVVVGGYAFFKVQEGTSSLKAFSAAQAVELSYNEDGQLVDGGEVAGAQSIMALLTEDWGYPVVQGELDPNDPIVNTGSEYMYQMATVSYHTLHGTQTIVLEEDYTAPDGTVYTAGTPTRSRLMAATGHSSTVRTRSTPLSAPRHGPAWHTP